MTSDLLLPGYWVDDTSGAWATLPWPIDPDEKMALVNASLGPQIIDWSEGRTDEPGLPLRRTVVIDDRRVNRGEPVSTPKRRLHAVGLVVGGRDEGRTPIKSRLDRSAAHRRAGSLSADHRRGRNDEHDIRAHGEERGVCDRPGAHQPITRPTPENRSLYQGPRKSMISTPSEGFEALTILPLPT